MEILELTGEEIEIIKSFRLKNKEKAKLWNPTRVFDSISKDEKEKVFDTFYRMALKELERVKFKEDISKGEKDVYYWFMKILGEDIFLNCIDHIDLKGTH